MLLIQCWPQNHLIQKKSEDMTSTYQMKMLRINSTCDLQPSSWWKTERKWSQLKEKQRKRQKAKGNIGRKLLVVEGRRKKKSSNSLKIIAKWAEGYFWEAIFFLSTSLKITHKNVLKKLIKKSHNIKHSQQLKKKKKELEFQHSYTSPFS